MPQVHNPSRLMDMDSSAFAKNSRYMASINFTEGSLRHMNALNFLEKRLTNIKVKYYNRHERIMTRKMERTRGRMLENLQKRMAYKLVLRTHSISKAKDYHEALKGSYSFESMQHEVKNMMYLMRPDHVREKRARMLIETQNRRYEEVIKKNKENIDRIFPPPKKWEPIDHLTGKKKGEVTPEPEKVATPLTNIERRHRQSLATLRRRIITIDEPKPELKSPSLLKQPLSPIKTPTISKQHSSQSLNSPRKQTITMSMSMMKKQKSFLETKEKTNLTENRTSDNKENEVDKTIVEKADESNAPGVTDRVKEESEGRDDENKNDTQKYKVLPPIKKTGNNVPASNNVTNSAEKVGKLPVLKMRKGGV